MDFWWTKKEGAESALFSHVSNLEEKQLHIQDKKMDCLYMYGDEYFDVKDPFYRNDDLTFNVIQMACDTAQAKIAKSKPAVEFLTDAGDYPMQRNAKLLSKYVSGIGYANNIYSLGRKIFLDGAIFGDGFLKYIVEEKELKMEKVCPLNIVVDVAEAKEGKPRQMYEKRYVNKYLLAELYPQYSSKILSAQSPIPSFFMDIDNKDNVLVIEGWRLGVGKKKGKHIIAISNETLHYADYNFSDFPFTRFSYMERSVGYWSRGISETLAKIQIEINRLLKTLQKTFEIGVIPQVYLEYGSKIIKTHLNNRVGNIVEFSGSPPIQGQLLKVPVELLNQIADLYAKAFEKVGLSQFSTSGTMPDSVKLQSGKAIREYNDTESERFSIISQNYEDFHVEVSKKIVEYSDYLSQNGGAKTVALDRNGIVELDWKKISLNKDKYIVKALPKSSLGQTPAGRKADVEDLINMGLINQAQALKLLDFPDVEAFSSMANSKVNDIEATIADIIDNGEYRPPEIMQDLELGIQMVADAFLRYRRLNVEEDRLEMLLMWYEEALAMLTPQITDEELELEAEQNQNALNEEEQILSQAENQGVV